MCRRKFNGIPGWRHVRVQNSDRAFGVISLLRCSYTLYDTKVQRVWLKAGGGVNAPRLASAPGSPPGSTCGNRAPSSNAGAADCAGPGETTAHSLDTCVVFASSSIGFLRPPMMRPSAPERDAERQRAEENEETFSGSFSKKTPPKKTTISDWQDYYTFRLVVAPSPHCPSMASVNSP